jgi:Bacterial Ig-like domain
LTATFTPNGNLAYSTAYTATATTGVKDAAKDPGPENAMKANFTLSFTTEDKPKSEGSGGGGCFISSACM